MSRNEALFERAQKTIPGGVNSPVRAFRSVGGTPRFIERAQGPYFWDADGKQYIDYIGSWGPMILGHVHPEVLEAVQRVLANGFSFGAPTESEIEIAEEICKLVPSIEQVRMVSSGTELIASMMVLLSAVGWLVIALRSCGGLGATMEVGFGLPRGLENSAPTCRSLLPSRNPPSNPERKSACPCCCAGRGTA